MLSFTSLYIIIISHKIQIDRDPYNHDLPSPPNTNRTKVASKRV